MMKHIHKTTVLVYMLNFIFYEVCSAWTFHEAVYLEKHFKTLSKNIKPRLNQSDKMEIKITIALNSIIDYDEVSGILKLVASFILDWKDEIRTWNSSLYGGITSFRIPITDTWIPQIYVFNMASKRTIHSYDNDIDISRSYALYQSNGDARLVSAGVQHVLCDSDVTYFPFDTHSCTIMLLCDNFRNAGLTPNTNSVYLGYALTNSEWSIVDTFAYNLSKTDIVQSNFTLVLSRNYLLLVLNLVVPVVLISFVNVLVFSIPVSSGERASLAFTMLLTFIVYLTMATNILPANDKISGFNIFLFVQLCCSVTITFLAVWSTSIFHKWDQHDKKDLLTRCLIRVYKILDTQQTKTCGKRRKRMNITDISITSDDIITETNINGNITEENFKRSVICFLDNICFRFFMGILLMQLLSYSILVYVYKL